MVGWSASCAAGEACSLFATYSAWSASCADWWGPVTRRVGATGLVYCFSLLLGRSPMGYSYFLRFAGRGAARFGGLLAGRLTAGGLPAPILSARRAMESNARLSFWAQKAPPLDL